MKNDLRGVLERLDAAGALRRVSRRVSGAYELPSLLKKTDGRVPICFEQVDDYACHMVAGLGGTRETLALAVGCRPDGIAERLARAVVNPLPVRRIRSGPVHENVVTAPFDIDKLMPVLRYNERDGGRFLISGVMVAKDISGKRLYTSIRRMQYLGGSRCCLLVTSDEMKKQVRWYEKEHKPMELAIMFGVSPAVVLGSQISTYTYHADKLDITGALLGEHLEVVHCKTVDIDVLADAEVVLEGRLLPWVKETEGPFGELGGYYGGVSSQPVIEFTAATYRDDPIAQTILAGSCEEKLPEAISREVALMAAISQTVPDVRAVNITMPGVGRFHAVIQIEKRSEGESKQALLAAFSSDKDLKHVVVVDTDVDIFNAAEVEWAIATRFQADIDLVVIPGAMGSPLEPSHRLRGVSAKMGLDATKPLKNSDFERTHIPGEENIDLRDYLD